MIDRGSAEGAGDTWTVRPIKPRRRVVAYDGHARTTHAGIAEEYAGNEFYFGRLPRGYKGVITFAVVSPAGVAKRFTAHQCVQVEIFTEDADTPTLAEQEAAEVRRMVRR